MTDQGEGWGWYWGAEIGLTPTRLVLLGGAHKSGYSFAEGGSSGRKTGRMRKDAVLSRKTFEDPCG